jgi:hypothetical protein
VIVNLSEVKQLLSGVPLAKQKLDKILPFRAHFTCPVFRFLIGETWPIAESFKLEIVDTSGPLCCELEQTTPQTKEVVNLHYVVVVFLETIDLSDAKVFVSLLENSAITHWPIRLSGLGNTNLLKPLVYIAIVNDFVLGEVVIYKNVIKI